MILVKLTNYLLGYVVFCARGGFSERFINLCSNNKIFIWDVRREGDCIFGCVEAADYRSLRVFAKKTGMYLRAEKKVGLPFLFVHNKYRFALPVAALMFVGIFFILSKFIWTVDVVGNENVPAEDVISAFEQLGVKPGKLKSSVDADEISHEALLLLDGIEWASVNLNGSNAEIEIKEKVAVPEISEKSNDPTNIISSVSGVVRRIDLYKGTKCVNVGDAVLQGDVLVTGAVTNMDTSVSFYRAQAYVSVQTSHSLTHEIKTQRFSRVYTKTKKKYILSFFSLEIPLTFPFPREGTSDCFTHSYFLESNGKKLPLGIICQRYDYYEEKNVSRDDVLSRMCATESFMDDVSKTFSDKLVLSQSVTVGKTSVYGVFETVQSAGEEVKMDVIISDESSAEQ